MAKVPKLQDQLNAALRKDKHRDALNIYDELMALEPDEARWPQRKGDLLKKLDRIPAAVTCFERAVKIYSDQGFVARAAALAKLILMMDGSRTDVLESISPVEARRLHRAERVNSTTALEEDAEIKRALKERRKSFQFDAVKLTPMPAEDDEIRFLDVDAEDDQGIDIVISGVEVASSPTIPAFETSDVHAPTTRRNSSGPPASAVPVPPPLPNLRQVPPPLPIRPTEIDQVRPTVMDQVRPTVMDQARPTVVDQVRPKPPPPPPPASINAHPPPLPPPPPPIPPSLAPSAQEIARMPSMPLFAEVPLPLMRRLVLESELIDLPKGAVLITQGEDSDALYTIIEGAVQINVPGVEEPLSVGEGGVVGESCLLDGVVRRASIRVTDDLRALKISKTVLDALVSEHPPMGDVLLEMLSRRLIANLMNISPVFKAFDDAGRAQLAGLFEVRRAEEGTVLVQEGKRMDGLYIPLLGTLQAASSEGTTKVPLGDVLGHDSLISYQPSDTTISAESDVLLLRLSLMRFTELASMFPSVLEYLSNLSLSD